MRDRAFRLRGFVHRADGRKRPVVGDADVLERLGRHALGLFRQAEQQMLAAHVGLLQRARLLLGQDKHMTRFVGKFLECHRRPRFLEK